MKQIVLLPTFVKNEVIAIPMRITYYDEFLCEFVKIM